MAYLLYTPHSRVTGRLLRNQLGISGSFPPLYCRRALEGLTDPLAGIIRWGSRAQVPGRTLLNQPEGINNASDKLRALNILNDAGVLVPPFSTDPAGLSPDAIRFGRSRRGYGGRDIRILMPGTVEQGCEFYTEYIPNTREYRIHVFRGEVIRVQGKWNDRPELNGSGLIRNYAHGYRFRSPSWQLNSGRSEAAIRAVAALGLDFGAVDGVIRDGGDREFYILEVNTAPSCSPLTALAYTTRMAEFMRVGGE